MDIYDREFLQNYAKYATWLSSEPRIVNRILQESIGGSKRYLIESACFLNPRPHEDITDWVVSRLKKRFPGVSVEYREATSLTGVVQRGIIVDWS